MFQVNWSLVTASFLTYLHEEGNEANEQHGFFLTEDEANYVIGRYLFITLRDSILDDWQKEGRIMEEERSQCILYASSHDTISLLHEIEGSLHLFWKENIPFHEEAFLRFRLRTIRFRLIDLLEGSWNVYRMYYDEDCSLLHLQEMLESHSPTEENLSLVANDHDELFIRGKETMYVLDKTENEDVIMSHLILLAPSYLSVFDPNYILSKEMVTILKQLFRERVTFIRDVYHHCSIE